VKTTQMAKFLLSPPGDTIQETIDAMAMSQSELAERMGRPKEKVNDIIKGREPITTLTAFQLEKVLGVPVMFWLNREKEFRKQLYEIEQSERFEQFQDWLNLFPVNELKKMGWLPDTKEKHVLINSLLGFFGVASPNEWKKIYMDDEIKVSFRISLAHTQSPHAISAWLRMGELQSRQLETLVYDKRKFRDSLKQIKELAYLMPVGFENKLQQICSQSGVALVYTPNLPKAPVSGATRWFNNKPVIQLSGRFKTDDHFWFTFFHEAAHIILHGKKDVFLENVDGAETDQQKEIEANLFAEKILLNPSEMLEIENATPIDENKIKKFSEKFGTPAGIIVGRLQHSTIVPFSFGNCLRQKIDLFHSDDQ